MLSVQYSFLRALLRRTLYHVYSRCQQLLNNTARLSPQVLAGEGVAQRPFVRTPAADRNGARPKSRRNCLRRKELEKASGLARREKEFLPRKKSFREGSKDTKQ
jgi:hypothetical protein